MKVSKQIIPGIVSVKYLSAELLQPDVCMSAICRNAVPVLVDLHEVSLSETPQCTHIAKRDGRRRTEEAQLKLHSSDTIPSDVPLAFVVMDAEGQCYLIGSRESPWPVVTVTREFGNADGSRAGYEYEITHKAICTLIKCFI